MLNCCMIECCEPEDKGSIGAFYVRYHAELAGHKVTVTDDTSEIFDIEMISVHHCNDFPRLAKIKKRARVRIVGGHPMQNNPVPCIPYADIIGVGEGETWIKNILNTLEKNDLNVEACRDIPGTIIYKNWNGIIPETNIEETLPDNPPYLNWEGTRSASWYIELARGCPFSCHYCELGNSTKFRRYSTEQILKKIDMCDLSKSKKINFFAPDEASYPDYQIIYDYVNRKGFTTAFSSMRIDSIMKNDIDLKPNAVIRVGVDGLTEKTRFRVNKKITDLDIIEYFKHYIEKGHATFKMFMIVGYEWDKFEDFEEFTNLIEEIRNIPMKKNVWLRIKWTPFIPQPCTPLRDSKPSYNYEWYCKIKEWHSINDKPRGNRGLFISCDGIMSVESHRKQVELTCGGLEVLKKYE